MADFEVRTDCLRDASERLNRTHHQVREISGEAKRILSNTRGSITARLAMHLQRAVVCTSITNCATDCKNISNTLEKIASVYESREKKVASEELFDDVNRPWWKEIFIGFPTIPTIIVGIPKPVLPDIWDVVVPWGPVFPKPQPWIPKPRPWYTSPWGRFPQTPSGPGGKNPMYNDITVGKLITSLFSDNFIKYSVM